MAEWLSVPQAAQILGVDRTTAWRWLGTYLQPTDYVNGKPIFTRQYIERLAAERQATGARRRGHPAPPQHDAGRR